MKNAGKRRSAIPESELSNIESGNNFKKKPALKSIEKKKVREMKIEKELMDH